MAISELDAEPNSPFDQLFVEADALAPPSRRPLRDGWQAAPLTEALARMPKERRETVMAMGFGLLALVYGPLGFVALLTGTTRIFLFATAVLVAIVAAPRPPWAQGVVTRMSRVAGDLNDRATDAYRASSQPDDEG